MKPCSGATVGDAARPTPDTGTAMSAFQVRETQTIPGIS